MLSLCMLQHCQRLEHGVPAGTDEQTQSRDATAISPVEWRWAANGPIVCMVALQVRKVPRIGNSPTFISVQHFKKLAPVWYDTTMAIFKDEAAHKVCQAQLCGGCQSHQLSERTCCCHNHQMPCR